MDFNKEILPNHVKRRRYRYDGTVVSVPTKSKSGKWFVVFSDAVHRQDDVRHQNLKISLRQIELTFVSGRKARLFPHQTV